MVPHFISYISRGESFGAISAAGANAALAHYDPTEEAHSNLAKNETFLLDCGGQYLGATTDVTRTIFIGEATEEIKHRYTRVLQGNIRLATGVFPNDTPGYKMEPLARLWGVPVKAIFRSGFYLVNIYQIMCKIN